LRKSRIEPAEKERIMSVWFEGKGSIECDIAQVEGALEDPGSLFVGIVRLMPGLVSVDLIDQGSDFVTIRTNEGLMYRTSISKQVDGERLVVEYDEKYEAGTKVTTTSHFLEEFAKSDAGVTHRLVISDVRASRFLGFLYRIFGSKRTGNTFLKAAKTYLEM
jgi:hypothetical protein